MNYAKRRSRKRLDEGSVRGDYEDPDARILSHREEPEEPVVNRKRGTDGLLGRDNQKNTQKSIKYQSA